MPCKRLIFRIAKQSSISNGFPIAPAQDDSSFKKNLYPLQQSGIRTGHFGREV
jgi:hypothetical protein